MLKLGKAGHQRFFSLQNLGLGFVVTSAGLAFLGWLGYLFFNHIEIAMSGTTAIARVVGVRTHPPIEGCADATITVQFQTPSGEDIQTDLFDFCGKQKLGGTVEVMYSPERPQDVRIKSFSDTWITPLWVGFLPVVGGVVVVIFGGALMFGFVNIFSKSVEKSEGGE